MFLICWEIICKDTLIWRGNFCSEYFPHDVLLLENRKISEEWFKGYDFAQLKCIHILFGEANIPMEKSIPNEINVVTCQGIYRVKKRAWNFSCLWFYQEACQLFKFEKEKKNYFQAQFFIQYVHSNFKFFIFIFYRIIVGINWTNCIKKKIKMSACIILLQNLTSDSSIFYDKKLSPILSHYLLQFFLLVFHHLLLFIAFSEINQISQIFNPIIIFKLDWLSTSDIYFLFS